MENVEEKTPTPDDLIKNHKEKENTLERILFSSKWLLIPFYFGLMFSLAVYTFIYIKEIYHLFLQIRSIEEEDAMMIILKLIDLTMVANLVKLIIIGSYTSFFKKNINESEHSDPNLNTSSGVLKVKMATALIGVTSINLLQSFIKPDKIDEALLHRQLIIHGIFLIGAVVLSVVDWMHVKSVAIHHEDCVKHNLKE